MIYADNAATTKLDIEAFELMKPYLLDDYANPSQPYSFSRKAKLAIKNARSVIAKCINADPDEIYFTSGGTESNNWVIKNFGFPTDIKHIITSEIEHHAVLKACKHMEENGATVKYLSADEKGLVNPEELDNLLRRGDEPVASCETTLVSVMMANNEIGSIEPVKELAEVAHKHGAYFHTDAVQAAGHIPIDVKKWKIDFLSASAHKFNGPKGIGFLYVRKGAVIQPHNDGGAQERGLRSGTENVASIIGMAKALENNVKHMEESKEKLLKYESIIENLLRDNGISYVRNGYYNHIPGNMSLSFDGLEGESILHRLDLMGICISTGSACDSQRTQISHVLKAIGMDKGLAEGTIRISFGKNNSEEDVLEIGKALVKVING